MKYFIKYTDENLKDWEAAKVIRLTIYIRQKFKGYQDILDHELEHIRQTYITLFLHPILYSISKKYRLWSETKAFLMGQYSHKTMTVGEITDTLYSNYNLGYSKDYISNYIAGKINE